MKWNPYLNGIGAAAYIWALVLLITHIARLHHDTPDNVVGSVAAISLFTFSAATMGFLFFYRPVMLLIEQKKGEAITYFFKTLLTFGALGLIAILFVI
ncbi:MAG TPA: hypothetical protein VHC20_03775 [Candidatus Paceibacterota bacterium]|nr:hypothetical protein [Candidatus Paceibacterota bacterium]